MKKKRIGILGIGGIGGYIGGHLLQTAPEEATTETIFICRGATRQAILQNGLILNTPGGTLHGTPLLASDQPDEIGTLDVLIIATKAYDLENALKPYYRCVAPGSLVLPLQNGVDARRITASYLPQATVLEGCIYVSAHQERPGIVDHIGGGKIIYGNEDRRDFSWLKTVFEQAGIPATYTHDIKKAVWKKFLFLSPFAAITTAYKITCGQIARDENHTQLFEAMLSEIQQLAIKKGVNLNKQDIAEARAMLQKFEPTATSSMELDFRHHATKTEKAYLIDYILEQGSYYQTDTSSYQFMDGMIKKEYGR